MAEEQLSAAQRSKIRRLSQPKELAPDEEGGELNIVPFLDIITNVLMFVLATVAVTFTTMIDSHPPSLGGKSARALDQPTLGLNVIIIDDGFIISAMRQRIGAGCTGTGSGVAVGLDKQAPARENGKSDYDYEALRSCADKLKHISADFAGEKQVAISANPDIEYGVIIKTMDALRKSASGEELFPDVNFGVPQ